MRRSVAAVAVVLLLSGLLIATGSPAPASASAASECRISTPSGEFAQPVAMSAGHARVWRMYQAFFLRQPDPDGFRYWFGVRARGAPLSQIAYQFSTSQEFESSYGRLGDGQFVDLIYRNVLCRTPDAGGRRYWLQTLSSGSLTRWDMVVAFVELREYLGRTQTCHSVHAAEDAAAPHCRRPALRPLAQANLASDGYQAVSGTVVRADGGIGTLHGVVVDGTRDLFRTGRRRCAVASINANYVLASEKNLPNPTALGLGVVDGVHVKGSADRLDRGVLGLRFDAQPKEITAVWPGDTLSPDDQRISSIWHHDGQAVIESWLASAEQSPYVMQVEPDQRTDPDEWVWAAAGVPLRINGQTSLAFDADYVNDPYSNQTLRHPFVAQDQQSKRIFFGVTVSLDAGDLVRWARRSGFEDLVKFDGGASTELNVGGQAVVGGTSRDLPVWLGIGC